VRAREPAPSAPETQRPGLPRGVVQDEPDSAHADELRALRAQVEELDTALAGAQGELERLRNERLQQGLSDFLAGRAREFTAAQSSEHAVAHGVSRIRHREEGWFGSLPATMALLSEMARLGEAGIDYALRRVGDLNVDLQERGALVEVLPYIPHERILDFLLRDHPDLEYSVEPEYLQHQIEGLPTEAVRRHAREIGQVIGDGRGSDEQRLLVALALIHDIPESRQSLRRLLAAGEDAESALEAINWLGTGPARKYLEEVSRTHHDRALRERAAALLEEW